MTTISMQRVRGFSLLEILIAVSLMAGAVLLLIITMRQGAAKTEAFSSEHFTAMFLAQKVIEDINDRVTMNPHFFNDLIASASGDALRVVDGQSPFFRLLENTKDYEKLDAAEDLPITTLSKDLYEQLKGFKCQVESRFVPNPDNPGQSIKNLIEVIITISWEDLTGKAHKYIISQLVYGQNKEIFRNPLPNAQPFNDHVAIKALCSWFHPGFYVKDFSLDEFMKFNKGGDETKVLALGRVLAGFLMCDSTVAEYDDNIKNASDQLKKMKSSGARPAVIVKMSEYIAQLREQKACMIFYIFNRCEKDWRELAKDPLTKHNMGLMIQTIKPKLMGVPILMANHLLKISLNFAMAENSYKKLLIPLKEGVSHNREIFLLQHFIEMRKIGVLFSFHWNLNPDARLVEHQNNIKNLMNAYQGKQPLFYEYLSRENLIAGSISSLRSECKSLDDKFADIMKLGSVLDQTRVYLEHMH
ncbi:MAG: hypothetical protein HQM10_26170 [Candidatus Riflebacteria bacterium]|nr:hypothetical protein [Candidatus Riflebacteria bacterium]